MLGYLEGVVGLDVMYVPLALRLNEVSVMLDDCSNTPNNEY